MENLNTKEEQISITLERIIKRKPSLLVIGDIMLDQYVFGVVDRISPEAPVPIVNFKKEFNTLGGCGNVIRNLANLEVGISMLCAIGLDSTGTMIKDKLRDIGLSADGILESPNIFTTHKMRILGQEQQIVRVDWDANPLTAEEYNKLEDIISERIQNVDGVIISDYNKGICTKQLTQSTIRLAKEKKLPVFIDPKGKDWDRYEGATIITPNAHEAEIIVGRKLVSDRDFAEAGKAICSKYNIHASLITRGSLGMSYVSAEKTIHLSSKAREVFDVSGAGDTVIACLTTAYVSNVSIEQAINFSNVAAGIVVGHIGTEAVTIEELKYS